jgi:hypothetical protein
MGSASTLTPDTNTDLSTTTTTAIAPIATPMNIGGIAGTATIIGTITIDIMIGITTGIDGSRLFCPILDLSKGTV